MRVLTVQLGAFNTNMSSAARAGKMPVPEDYKGSAADQFTSMMISGNFKPDGDQEKAMKAVYEVIVGVGVGAGREAERMLPLGRDLAANLKHVQDGYAHAVEVFGEVCNNVHL